MTPADPDRPLGVYDPVAVRNRLNRYMKRRLSDDLEGLVHAACLGGDLEMAEELLAALRHKLQRDCEKYGRDRRMAGDLIERIAAELENHKAMKQFRSEQAAVEDQQIATASRG
jgi:hypothetical protein